MSGPEARFRDSVHKHLPSRSELHREGMANPYRGGTPDYWYSGKGVDSRDLWVEWKFILLPARPTTMIDLVGGKKPTLSHLQQEWLRSRFEEGRQVRVIVGSKAGGVIFTQPDAWEIPISAKDFMANALPPTKIAAQIVKLTTGRSEVCHLSKSFSQRRGS